MRNTLINLVAVVTLLNISAAHAGECIPKNISVDYIESTDLIFEGHLSTAGLEETAPSSQEHMVDNLTITKLWKGEERQNDTLTLMQNRYHGRGLYSGRSYLVFANKYSDNTYSTSGCELIVEIAEEKPYEIEFLEGYFNRDGIGD